MSQLDWFGTLFPRIPVPIEKKLHEHISAFRRKQMGGDSANAPTADAAPSAAPEPAAAAATRKSSSPQPVAKANAARADNTRYVDTFGYYETLF